jgi:hypothetical protein
MSQDTNVNNLIINKLTKAQYDNIQNPSATELYLVTDDVGITSSEITTILGYIPENVTNKVTSISSSSTDTQYPSAKAVYTQLNNKQAKLVSGTNIKTINNNSILGSGNITIDSLPSQSGQSGKFLTTNGTTASWSNVSIPTVDQTFDVTSTNAQSGVAIAGELDNYQSLITSTNMISSDLVDDTNSTHKFATSTQLTQIGTNQTDISTIEGKIPSQASTSNQLADKAFVNSSVQTATANFRGNWSTWTDVPTSASSYPADYAESTTPTVNDYLVVQDASDYTGDTLEGTWRFKYTGTWSTDGKSGWNPEYQVNETPLTAAQLAALNSGITSSDVTLIGTALQPNDLPTNHVTTDTNQNITGTKTFVGTKKIAFKQSGTSDKLGFTLYNNNNVEKGYLEFNPTNIIDGAPLMTLGNYASSASGITQVGFRRYSSVSGANGAYNLLTPLIADAKTPFNLTTTYTNFYLPLGFTDGTTTVKTAKTGLCDLSSILPDISTKQDTLVSGTNIKTINNTSLLGSGNIDISGGGAVDQTYDGTSTNAQSGVAIEGAGFLKNSTSISDSLAIGNNVSPHGGRYSVLLGHSAGGQSGTVALGYNANGDSNTVAIGYSSSASGNGSTSIGSASSATGDYAIQLGCGTNSTNNSLSVGFYNSYTEHYNWQLLDGTTGLIPDARLSSNIARASQLPDISTKQDTLVSGTNIKTINNESVLGSGNFQLQKIEYEGGDWSLGVNSLNDHSWGSIVQTNDKYVALSSTGWISTSTDGTTWTTPVQNTTLGANNWYGLCYNGDKFVTLSSNGSISTSTDGTTWTTPSQISNLGDHSWQALTYGNGKFVGISSAGWVSDSSDGTTWNTSTRDTNLAAYQGVSSITYGNNKFVALGRAGYVWTSTDGITWSTGTKVFNNISASWLGLDYYNGHFIAINNDGYISTSTDGTTWTTPTQPENLTVSTWNDICGTVIIGWYGYVSKLQENTVLSDISGNLLSVGFSNNTYPVLDGTTGLIPDARISSNIARTSAIPDISTKQDVLVSGTNIKTINDISMLGSGNIEVQSKLTAGDNIVIYEPGYKWSTGILINDFANSSWNGMAYDGSKFVAIRYDGYISTSIDGLTWATPIHVANLDTENFSLNWGDVIYDGTKFIALGEYGYISTSIDGTTWTEAEDVGIGESCNWHRLAYNGNIYIALGANGWISTSTDGTTWTGAVQNSDLQFTDSAIRSVAYGNGKFIVVGYNHYAVSSDGLTWTKTYGIGEGGEVIGFDGTKFISLSIYGSVNSTIDGTSWVSVGEPPSGIDSSPYNLSLCFDGNKFVLLTDTGYVSVSTPVISSPGNYLQNTATGTGALTVGGTASGYTGGTNIGTSSQAKQNYGTALGYNTNANGNSSTCIGRNAGTSAASAIQIGAGVNSTANTLQVGFIHASTNWPLLDGTTGLIPDARISSNIARASAIPTMTYNSLQEKLTWS